MTKRSIIIVLLLTVSLSVILPIIFRDKTETFNQTINIVATLISSIASVMTLVIAIVLFNKFGIETPLLQKNTEIVFSFVEEFKKTRFTISGKSYSLYIQPHDSLHKYFEERYAEKLLFSMDFLKGLENLFKISESPFMPKTISEKVDRLKFYILVMDVKEEDLHKYATVTVSGQSLIGAEFGRFNEADMTLFEFINIIDDLRTEIDLWFKKHSNYSPDLNF